MEFRELKTHLRLENIKVLSKILEEIEYVKLEPYDLAIQEVDNNFSYELTLDEAIGEWVYSNEYYYFSKNGYDAVYDLDNEIDETIHTVDFGGERTFEDVIKHAYCLLIENTMKKHSSEILKVYLNDLATKIIDDKYLQNKEFEFKNINLPFEKINEVINNKYNILTKNGNVEPLDVVIPTIKQFEEFVDLIENNLELNIQKTNFKSETIKYKPTTKAELKELVNNLDINLKNIDTSLITDMSYLFYKSKRENFSGIENWDTSKVKDMSYMFYGCKTFNQPLNFNTSNVEDMSSMFAFCYNFNQPLNFNTSNVKDMRDMFWNCPNLDKSKVSFLNTNQQEYIKNNEKTITSTNDLIDELKSIRNSIRFGNYGFLDTEHLVFQMKRHYSPNKELIEVLENLDYINNDIEYEKLIEAIPDLEYEFDKEIKEDYLGVSHIIWNVYEKECKEQYKNLLWDDDEIKDLLKAYITDLAIDIIDKKVNLEEKQEFNITKENLEKLINEKVDKLINKTEDEEVSQVILPNIDEFSELKEILNIQNTQKQESELIQ